MKRILPFSVVYRGLFSILIIFSFLLSPSHSLALSEEQKLFIAEQATFSGSIVLYVGNPEALVNGNSVRIDENPLVVPFIENSRTLMPLSFVAKTMGFGVEWQEAERTVTLKKDKVTLEFKLGSTVMKNNSVATEMETAAISRHGRTLIPISYVAKALGINVTYDRGLIILDSAKTYSLTADKEYIDSMISRLSGLPIVGSSEVFNTILKDIAKEQQRFYEEYYNSSLAFALAAPNSPRSSGTANQSSNIAVPATQEKTDVKKALIDKDEVLTDHSDTNIQVEGVDEADIVKTDGDYIYHLAYGILNIIKADGSGQMERVCALNIPMQNYRYSNPLEMYVDGSTICVIGVEEVRPPQYEGSNYPNIKNRSSGTFLVKVLIYDTSDKSAPLLTREFSMEGRLLTSRKVENKLYLVLNYNMYFYNLTEPCQAAPYYSDSTDPKKTELVPLDYSRMHYLPDYLDDNMLIICGLDTTESETPIQTIAIIGSGNTVYMSPSALYIAKHHSVYYLARSDNDNMNNSSDSSSDLTTFFKFALDNGYAIYQGKGTAKGKVLNQYSMDEFNGYFRAAMTVNVSDGISQNALNIFAANMDLCGNIADMAPGEHIYAARFMGERAFMVTYRDIDPLFAMDLSDPYNPKVLGELKIPGYSTYLLAYDENHLIGFGRDTEVLTTTDSNSNIVSVRTVNSALRLALFDISDLTDPRELYGVTIGDEHTESTLLHDFKALLFSKKKGFIAFPVSEYLRNDGTKAFNGIYVYDISPNGITLRGTVFQGNRPKDNPNYWYSNNRVNRILYIDNAIFTASDIGMQAANMTDLKIIKFLDYSTE
jgi:uncharacterized secreted protein with C-terminal beta-propeller domain